MELKLWIQSSVMVSTLQGNLYEITQFTGQANGYWCLDELSEHYTGPAFGIEDTE
jgi:hypothetical protein